MGEKKINVQGPISCYSWTVTKDKTEFNFLKSISDKHTKFLEKFVKSHFFYHFSENFIHIFNIICNIIEKACFAMFEQGRHLSGVALRPFFQ
jgi:hypothetical protein